MNESLTGGRDNNFPSSDEHLTKDELYHDNISPASIT